MAHVPICSKLKKLLAPALAVLALALGPIACSTSNPPTADGVHSEHTHSASLELNAGKKWVVDKPMMGHLRKIETEVQNFENTPGGDHAVLAKDIQENLGQLVTKCTMEGKAHDELHKWLMPLLGASAEYAKTTEPSVQQAKLRQIKESLQVFHSYFEE